MERKLATLKKIDEIVPIEGADRIESAKIGGWNVVVKKNEFKAGELCVFVEVDGFLPEEPRYEFLRGNCYKMNYDGTMGFRLRTVRLRKTLSQGLALPLSVFPEITSRIEGEDVTELLKITKFEKPMPACLSGVARGNFPSYIMKTDAERCCSEETIIYTEDGVKTIKEICESKYMGRVLSFNHTTEQDELKEILAHSIKTRKKNQWLEITTESGNKIKITKNHKIWIENLKCYRIASELKIGNILKIYKKD